VTKENDDNEVGQIEEFSSPGHDFTIRMKIVLLWKSKDFGLLTAQGLEV